MQAFHQTLVALQYFGYPGYALWLVHSQSPLKYLAFQSFDFERFL
jgi:hypothetical protein